MFRMLTVSVAVVAGSLFIPATASAQTIKLGEPFQGQLAGKAPDFARTLVRAAPPWIGFGSLHLVTLKEGQPLKLLLTARGNRKAGVALFDATGRMIESSQFGAGQAKLEVEEIPASGRYVILVFSDGIGGFKLIAESKLNEQQLKDKIKRLKKELKEAEEQLEALKKGSTKE